MTTIHKSLSYAAGVAMLALLLGFTASAQGQGKSEKFSYNFAFSPCNGELIETTGTGNFVYSFEEDENGCIKVRYHFNTQNVRGVGMDTGDEYRIIEVGNQKVSDVTLCGGCMVEIDVVSTYKVIAKNGESFHVHNVFTVLIDVCTWEFTFIEKQFKVDCK
jgi:hypothetical protein